MQTFKTDKAMSVVMENRKYDTAFYRFNKWPDSDACWSLSTGPDGRIYAAACVEITPGSTVYLTRYNDQTNSIDYLLEMDKALGDPRDSGRATQCKIHYSFVPDSRNGILYMATHLSGPPKGRASFSPWHSWYGNEMFRGSVLLAYDTSADKALWHDLMIPKQGCRCLCFDQKHDLFYALSYPLDHFIVYDLATRESYDMGRIGSVNCQAIFLDRFNRAVFADDQGYLVRYDHTNRKLERLFLRLPHEHFQTGWHSVLYDAVASPDNERVYFITWIADSHLIRYTPQEKGPGILEDMGRLTQERDPTVPMSTYQNHCGGLVFGNDGMLYMVAAKWERDFPVPLTRDIPAYGSVLRIDPETGSRSEVAKLRRPSPEGSGHYVSRGARDRNGDIFFGHVGTVPVGFFKMKMNVEEGRDNHLPLRIWG